MAVLCLASVMTVSVCPVSGRNITFSSVAEGQGEQKGTVKKKKCVKVFTGNVSLIRLNEALCYLI